MSDKYAVQLCNLSKTYSADRSGSKKDPQNGGEAEGVVAVKQVDLDIPQGEFFTLLGPSGCGKTTTLRLIAGFEQPTTGEVRIQGEAMQHVAPNRRPVNTVFQNYALFPHLTVGENVAFGLNVKRVDKAERKQRVADALDLVRLPDVAERKPSQLSGGQQQRIALARAVVNRPVVLLLDEPLGALDLKLRKEMQMELKRMQQELGITFIYVTHDQEEALTMSDRIAVMRGGVVQQIADPVTLYEEPANRFVADFIGESNFLRGEVDSVLGDAGQGEAKVWVDGVEQPLVLPVNGQALSSGQEVTLTVRPEKLTISPADAAAGESANTQATTGTVRDVIYLGTDTRYLVELPSGEGLTVRQPNVGGRAAQGLAVGESARVAWQPGDVRLLVE